ncbi:hypothetical protein F4604DRAFT_1687581 [Suillus subluteus]|nr:hypothetical protein F4604DRAFT_1687581 [Suillus subluteus]
MTNNMKTIKDLVDQLAPTIKSLQDSLTNSTNTNINTRLNKLQQEMTTLVKEATQMSGYKAALLTGLDTDANNQTACQILINVALDSPVAPSKVSHAQLVEKIKTALATLTDDSTPELNIQSVMQYRNGGTILEMMTAEAVAHLKKANVKENFIKTLDPKAIFKDRAYPVVIQFVPLMFDPDSEDPGP